MTTDLPAQQPEGRLIQEALQVDGRSIRQVAALAGMSDTRWRQIVKGSMHVGGVVTAVTAPPYTLARMAQVIGVTAQQLREVGRGDAASLLENRGRTPAEGPDVAPQPAASSQADEIDMIYESQSMNAEQKLEAIRKVLQLRAQADAESATRNAGSTARTTAND